ncbi:zinc-responsive transcriptional regulator [Streptomyces sp. YIM 130001]|uniref:MerR family transcriptional regulator n=1 Tax=Streptomyces sp. YIM 130001 TaxID=2259644 RepID=UPI000E64933C|nr:MerR family transcriptional regulator [Streptomyces sp. YIM 130001]RII11310.1 zinc-responsive transcriptional regulator [Streptomyces sp. YIM 130001]
MGGPTGQGAGSAQGDTAAGGPLRTRDVAEASGYSVQQVRDLERLGVLPPAQRSPNGYRAYSPAHVLALRAYRGLAIAVGPVPARRLLGQLRAAPLAEAAAAVGELHAGIARERADALHAQDALRAIRDEARSPAGERPDDAMTITQLADALRVRPSTLRFWEQERLVAPERVTSLRARRYGVAAVRQARVVTALRAAGHGIPEVRELLGTLHRLDGLDDTHRVLARRLDRLAVRGVALLRAGSDLAELIDGRAGQGRGSQGAASAGGGSAGDGSGRPAA